MQLCGPNRRCGWGGDAKSVRCLTRLPRAGGDRNAPREECPGDRPPPKNRLYDPLPRGGAAQMAVKFAYSEKEIKDKARAANMRRNATMKELVEKGAIKIAPALLAIVDIVVRLTRLLARPPLQTLICYKAPKLGCTALRYATRRVMVFSIAFVQATPRSAPFAAAGVLRCARPCAACP